MSKEASPQAAASIVTAAAAADVDPIKAPALQSYSAAMIPGTAAAPTVVLARGTTFPAARVQDMEDRAPTVIITSLTEFVDDSVGMFIEMGIFDGDADGDGARDLRLALVRVQVDTRASPRVPYLLTCPAEQGSKGARLHLRAYSVVPTPRFNCVHCFGSVLEQRAHGAPLELGGI